MSEDNTAPKTAPVKKLTDLVAIQRIRRMREELGPSTWDRVLNFLTDEHQANEAQRLADAFRDVGADVSPSLDA